MRLQARLERLERRAAERFRHYSASLDEEEFVLAFLRSVESDFGRLDEEIIFATLVTCGGEVEEWREVVEGVLTEHYEPIPRTRGKAWRPKKCTTETVSLNCDTYPPQNS